MSVSEKSTKKQILDAYQSSLSEIKKLKADQLDPKTEKAKVRAQELKELTSTDTVTGVLEDLIALTDRVPNYVGDVVETIRGHAKKVGEMEEELEVQKKELLDLYGISSEAETLAALVDTKRKVRTDLDESIEDVKKGWAEEKEEQEKRHARESEEAEQAHSRKVAEWEYEFIRHTKVKKDELQDALAASRKSFQEELDGRMKAFGEKREELEKREATMSEIEAKLTGMEQQLASIKEARELELQTVKEEAKAKAKTSFAIEVNAIKKSHDAETTVLAAKVENLEQQLTAEREDNGALSAKLNDAYAKIQDVALKSLESQGNARMVEMSRSMAAEQGRPNKN